jgi:hypothetical protein
VFYCTYFNKRANILDKILYHFEANMMRIVSSEIKQADIIKHVNKFLKLTKKMLFPHHSWKLLHGRSERSIYN